MLNNDNIIFEILLTYTTMQNNTYIFTWLSVFKRGFKNVYSGKVPDSANGNSLNITGSSWTHFQALSRPAYNSLSEEQRQHPTLYNIIFPPFFLNQTLLCYSDLTIMLPSICSDPTILSSARLSTSPITSWVSSLFRFLPRSGQDLRVLGPPPCSFSTSWVV